ncbi:MAG: divergent polysaccharide deacetylase family protein [Candidatus Acidiferrales bacterium]
MPRLRFFNGEKNLFSPARRSKIFVLLALILIFSACHKKNPSSENLRSATRDLVAAAQQVAGRDSQISIRPEMQSAPGGSAQLVADHIFITLADPSRRDALVRSLDDAAARHGLAHVARSSSSSALRFDYTSGGHRTHSILVIIPVPAFTSAPVRAPISPRAPKLAIILDDLGNDRAAADAILSLHVPLSISVLPNLPDSAEIAEEAHRHGDEVLLHLPMESNDGSHAETVELRTGMNDEEVDSTLNSMLASVPYATGVNNHQGSLATADPQLMAVLMSALRKRGLFFIDSRTTDKTVAYDAAEHAGVRAASRKVFLDDTQTRAAILKQISLAESDARRDGSAIAIGHPHPTTLAALEEMLPRLEARGIRLVLASDLAH